MQETLFKIEKKITLRFNYLMEKIGILIFARTNSKRFPKKVIALINKRKTLIELIHARVKKRSKKYLVIVNTSLNKSDDIIVSLCRRRKIKFFRGSLNNVFDRAIQCCKKFKLDAFVRVNADRPFFDFNLMQEMIKIFKSGKFDIVTNQLSNNCPKGLACEIAKIKIFNKLKINLLTKNEKEHIFNYFYKKKNDYKIKNLIKSHYKRNKKLNLSIDTKKDFKIVENIYKKFKNDFYVDTKKVLNKFN